MHRVVRSLWASTDLIKNTKGRGDSGDRPPTPVGLTAPEPQFSDIDPI